MELAQAVLRAQTLEPFLAGPMARMLKAPRTKRAFEALFGDSRDNGRAVTEAISALQARNPWAARQLVRHYLERIFANSEPDPSGVASPFIGAGFASTLQANPQIAERLAGALDALPNGAAIAPGFQRFLESLRATGRRRPAKPTGSFAAEPMPGVKLDTAGTSGAAGASVQGAAAGGCKWPSPIDKKIERWRLGRNLDELADLLVNPEAGQRFRQLANAPAGSAKARTIALRLAVLAGQGIRHRTQQRTK